LQAVLRPVFCAGFDKTSSIGSPEARATLAKDAKSLKQQGSVKIRIKGNCDELGADDYNLSLGESRANAAMSYLEPLEIQQGRLSVISYGKEKPPDASHDEAGRAKTVATSLSLRRGNRRPGYAIWRITLQQIWLRDGQFNR